MKLYLQFVLRYLYPKSSSNFSSNASILAIVGLSIGLFSLILTMSIIKGFEITLEQKLSSIDGLIRVQNIFGKPISEKENLDSLLYSSGLLIDVKPYIRGTAMIHRGKQTQGVIIEGIKAVPNQSFFIMDEQAVDEDDIILGESLSQILDVSIEDNVIITPLINTSKELIKKKYSIIKVSGLFKSGMQEYDNTISFVSIDKAKRIFEMDDHVTGYIVNSNEKIENIIEVLNDFVRYPYYLESWKDRHRVIFEWINIQRLPIIIIFGLIALVAITNIMATISMIIREKNSQVGILMALGMKTSDIRKIFLFQGGVNSINWARIVAQSVYYFFCYFKLDKKGKVSFSVPTGNFGDVYAGYLAKKMGLPIDKLLVATNENDILHRA
ncbi:MAG: hypothetical protein CMG41_04680, partial [Candidatus Marinimicrobia bacterium]|nr:hypothetical protein [Candidatus Neomarinimicrobiota bacterium]